MKRSITILLLLLLVTACASNEKRDNALAALRKIDAATQVGTQFQQYNALVIDAKTQVNSLDLSDGELKQEINAAMQAYADANTVWAAQVSGNTIYTSNEEGKRLKQQYGLS